MPKTNAIISDIEAVNVGVECVHPEDGTLEVSISSEKLSAVTRQIIIPANIFTSANQMEHAKAHITMLCKLAIYIDEIEPNLDLGGATNLKDNCLVSQTIYVVSAVLDLMYYDAEDSILANLQPLTSQLHYVLSNLKLSQNPRLATAIIHYLRTLDALFNAVQYVIDAAIPR